MVNQKSIHVDLSLTLVKQGFEFKETIDLGDVSGSCQECGHPIRYENIYLNTSTNDEYVMGSKCRYKLYVLDRWGSEFSEEDLTNKHLLRAGKWLWIIIRDGLADYLEKPIPHPNDFKDKENQFKELADELKRMAIRARAKIKRIQKEKAKKDRERKQALSRRVAVINFLKEEGILLSVCNDRDIKFLNTVYKYRVKGYGLSDKQQKWLDSIKERSRLDEIPMETDEESEVVVEETEEESQLKVVEEIVKKCGAHWDSLDDWNQNFLESISKQVRQKRKLSEKQMAILSKIQETFDNANELFDKYVGRKLKPWICNKKVGDWGAKIGVVSVKKLSKTGKAILCDLAEIHRNGNKHMMEDEWVPVSQVGTEIIL